MDTEKKVVYLDLNDILPNRFQPRIKFDDEAITELALSIKEHGVLQPIIVRPISDKYEIIAGERRYKASIVAGLQTIPAIVATLDDRQSAEIALIENVQRQDLTPIEKAVSYKKILDMGYLTQEQLANKIGKSQSAIANLLRLLNLPEEVQDALLDGKISERHARSLLRLKNSAEQKQLLNKILEERLTVRALDQEIDKLSQNETEIKIPTLDTLFKKEETMTNNDINNLNIPTTPIANDTPSPVVEEIKTEYDIDSEAQNPGFMDLNKIEQKADNIYDIKPQADLESLLKPVEPVPTLDQAPVEPSLSVDPLQVPTPVVENKEEPVQMLSAEPALMPTLDPVAPVLDPAPLETPKEEAPTVPTTGRFLNFEIPAEAVTEEEGTGEQKELVVEKEESQNKEVASAPTSFDSLFSSMNTVPTPVETQPMPAITPVPTVEQLEAMGDTALEPKIEDVTPTENGQALPADQPPIIMPRENPEIDLTTLFAPPPPPEKTDFKVVINNIRDLVNKIEKDYGYHVELDEIDFDDNYQVTIKINKNN